MDEVAKYVERLADDALIAGQRLCEWCAHAPSLEEDLALANTGLNYLGRARFLYAYAAERLGKTEDQLAFLKTENEYQNALIAELPCGDFAFSMTRQYLVDAYDVLFFQELRNSKDKQLAAIAEKTCKEVSFQEERSKTWMLRLGLGTTESQARAQTALDELSGYVAELFEQDELEASLSAAGFAVDRKTLLPVWQAEVGEHLRQAQLNLEIGTWNVAGGRQGSHTEHMGYLLAEMQFMQRTYPGLEW